jgi:hypothetical protein
MKIEYINESNDADKSRRNNLDPVWSIFENVKNRYSSLFYPKQ